ncbi:hypothetical protein [Devosia sp.]|uniref:hypothetical protein n=1 Tax=Devosia sp. TaxID=1871048 RepID=UPI001B2E6BDC|nr:hypothetical protein [Devosia sp.]MBO9590343.1 hypothetical protein [Devosia sp.]
METARETHRTAVATAISAELQRQAEVGELRVDVEALAEAVLRILDPQPPVAEGQRPEELNSSNDG